MNPQYLAQCVILEEMDKFSNINAATGSFGAKRVASVFRETYLDMAHRSEPVDGFEKSELFSDANSAARILENGLVL